MQLDTNILLYTLKTSAYLRLRLVVYDAGIGAFVNISSNVMYYEDVSPVILDVVLGGTPPTAGGVWLQMQVRGSLSFHAASSRLFIDFNPFCVINWSRQAHTLSISFVWLGTCCVSTVCHRYPAPPPVLVILVDVSCSRLIH